MKEPSFFIPPALARASIQREGRITRDLSMPERDWSKYEAPTYTRRTAKLVRMPRERVSIKQAE